MSSLVLRTFSVVCFITSYGIGVSSCEVAYFNSVQKGSDQTSTLVSLGCDIIFSAWCVGVTFPACLELLPGVHNTGPGNSISFLISSDENQTFPRVIRGCLQQTFIVMQTVLRGNVCGFETVDLQEDITSNCLVAIYTCYYQTLFQRCYSLYIPKDKTRYLSCFSRTCVLL